MSEIIVTCTRPALNQFEFGVRLDSRWLAEGQVAHYVPADLTPEQADILETGRLILQALAEEDAGALPPGQSVRLETSRPTANQIEYALVEGATLVRHGLVLTFNPAGLSGGDVAALVAARTLLGELATADATARGLI